mmetsp:Transcript_50171/g.145498  ORF Transcript_50171/g.145498 Transcript_50171/m.145498 type:complete len:91 (-) Transcript_50171:13-285(-)
MLLERSCLLIGLLLMRFTGFTGLLDTLLHSLLPACHHVCKTCYALLQRAAERCRSCCHTAYAHSCKAATIAACHGSLGPLIIADSLLRRC